MTFNRLAYFDRLSAERLLTDAEIEAWAAAEVRASLWRAAVAAPLVIALLVALAWFIMVAWAWLVWVVVIAAGVVLGGLILGGLARA